MAKRLVTIGNGMVGHRFLEQMTAKGGDWELISFCEEPRVAYDRVNLSGYFAGKTAEDLSLVEPGFYQQNNVRMHVGDKVVGIDRANKTVTSAQGRTIEYDKLVIATGSYPFVPPIKGNDLTGAFVYRTICDLEAIEAYAKTCKVGVVVGGGLLGLECANALQNLGLETHVIEFMPRLMPVQVDELGGAVLKQQIEALGIGVHTSKSTTEIVGDESGRIQKMQFADGTELAADMVVFSAGIRPQDELARQCGLSVGERGGVVIDDYCQTSDVDIYAIGECALYDNRIYGLVAPGYRMAEVLADRLMGADSQFTGADMSTKLKLLGIDVASFGDAFAATAGSKVIAINDAIAGTYKKLVSRSTK